LINNILKLKIRLLVFVFVTPFLIIAKSLPQRINDVVPEAFNEGQLLPLRKVTVIETNNNDNYFSLEDLEYYKTKYSRERIEYKEPVTIR